MSADPVLKLKFSHSFRGLYCQKETYRYHSYAFFFFLLMIYIVILEVMNYIISFLMDYMIHVCDDLRV